MRRFLLCLVVLGATGCPRQVGSSDAGADDAGRGTFDAGDYDPVAGNGYDGPLIFDDERVARIDGSMLRAGNSPCRAPILGRVYRVSDGDTVLFTASDGSLDARVRMIGIDTPEIAHDGMPADCYGPEAQDFTEQLVDHTVWLTFDSTCYDSFDRLLAYVHIGSGAGDLWERQLLRRGYARVLTIGANRQFRGQFEDDESTAMSEDAGLWSACF